MRLRWCRAGVKGGVTILVKEVLNLSLSESLVCDEKVGRDGGAWCESGHRMGAMLCCISSRHQLSRRDSLCKGGCHSELQAPTFELALPAENSSCGLVDVHEPLATCCAPVGSSGGGCGVCSVCVVTVQ